MNTKTKTIRFNKEYDKLNKEYFSTIRLKDKKLELFEQVNIITPTKEFKAEVRGIQYLKLQDIDIGNIAKDIDMECYNRGSVDRTLKCMDSLLNELRSIYPNIRWSTYVYYYSFKKNSIKQGD